MDPTVRNMVAGLAAGGATTLVMHPLDLIKVRLQVDEGKHGFGYITNLVKRTDSLYRGIGPNLLGNTVSWGLYFVLYNELVDRFVRDQDARQYMACAMTAGTTTSALTNPIWVLKTRMLSSNRNDPYAYKSMLQGIKSIWVQDGMKGYWKGFFPGLFGVFQASIQISIYQKLKDRWQNKNEVPTTFEYLTLSAVSKSIATISMYPYQVARSRLQTHNSSYKSSLDVITKVYQNEGLLGFYKGMVTNLIRVVPATCITFIVYEQVKASL